MIYFIQFNQDKYFQVLNIKSIIYISTLILSHIYQKYFDFYVNESMYFLSLLNLFI
jgi:hypothetical protein